MNEKTKIRLNKLAHNDKGVNGSIATGCLPLYFDPPYWRFQVLTISEWPYLRSLLLGSLLKVSIKNKQLVPSPPPPPSDIFILWGGGCGYLHSMGGGLAWTSPAPGLAPEELVSSEPACSSRLEIILPHQKKH